jgi:predicted MFS family arabinose efflux permease
MSAAAEPLEHIVPDDNLARRNAMVLSAAQALAGGNNTVIVSTASIVGAVLAPDKGLATLPVTAMVFGMWLGTLPLGVLARKFGRRFALQCGSAFGILSGLISYSAVMNGNFWLLLFGTFCGGLYAGRASVRTGSRPPIPRAMPIDRRSFHGCLRAAFLLPCSARSS